METKRKHMLAKSIGMVPLFLAFLWMGYLVFNINSADDIVRLSPSRIDTMINGLFMFIICYSIVLIYMFYKMNKELKDVEAKVAEKKEVSVKKKK